MARRDAPGAVHHVLLRGIERGRIFLDDADREDFLARLDRNVFEAGAACLAWALIPNHVHMVLRTGQRPLSELMRRLDTGYARSFNLRHRRSGYLFENRFRSICIEDDAYLRVLIRYVHLNPLRAGLVPSLEALAAYRWAGHAGLMGRQRRGFHAVEEVLGWFGGELGVARAALICWMREGMQTAGDRPLLPAPASRATKGQSEDAPGPRAALERAGGKLSEVRARELRARGWTLDALIEWVCAERGIDAGRLRRGGRSREESRARAVIGYLATRELGYTVLEISRAAGVGAGAMSRSIRRGAVQVSEEGLAIPLAPAPG